MNIPASESFIPIMVDRIVARFAPYRVILFGSHARERTRKWSDIDFLVVLPNGTDQHHAAVEIHRTLGASVKRDTALRDDSERVREARR